MNEEQKAFETKWHEKIVRPKGVHYQIPQTEYLVSAALYKWDPGDITIFAIVGPDGPPNWFTIKVAPEDLHWIEEDFEIVK